MQAGRAVGALVAVGIVASGTASVGLERDGGRPTPLAPVPVAADAAAAVGAATAPGSRVLQRNNVFVNSGPPETTGSVVAPRTFYSYSLDAAGGVPAAVRSGAGAGRLG